MSGVDSGERATTLNRSRRNSVEVGAPPSRVRVERMPHADRHESRRSAGPPALPASRGATTQDGDSRGHREGRALFQGRAEEEIVVARRLESGEPHRQRDLRPVTDLVQPDVKQQLARAHRPLLIAHLERPDLVGHVGVEIRGELLELAADGGAVVEQRRRIVAGQAGRVGERRLRSGAEGAGARRGRCDRSACRLSGTGRRAAPARPWPPDAGPARRATSRVRRSCSAAARRK